MSLLELGRCVTVGDVLCTDGGVDVPPNRGSLPHDELFSLLRSPRRRLAVRLLATEGGMTFRELVDRMAAVEAEGESPSYDERKRVYVSLRQTHLLKLSAAGVIDYDEQSGDITPTDSIDLLYRPLRAVDRTMQEQRSTADD